MLYAKVVVGLPVEGPFDYIVPQDLAGLIKVGSRAWVSFGRLKKVGYVVGLTAKTSIKNLKKIISLIDSSPVLDKGMLLLTRQLADYYCCSWGEAIESALPQDLRRGRKLSEMEEPETEIKTETGRHEALLLHYPNYGRLVWQDYFKYINEAIKQKKSVIIIIPDINVVLRLKDELESSPGLKVAVLFRKKSGELNEWVRIKSGKANIVIGTRSAIFAPASNLGLVIIDAEDDPVYKQDQVPHYHARDVALMRAKIEGAKVILGSNSPSLESYYLAKKGKIKYEPLVAKQEPLPEIKIIDMKFEYGGRHKRNTFLSRYLIDSITACVNSKEKVLLFLNRRGFATFASCSSCAVVLRCPRCNINLVFHFEGNILACHYCNFKMEPPKICPACNSGYIKYSGAGTEKIESELSRIFAARRIKRIDAIGDFNINDSDIFVASGSILKQQGSYFDLVGVLSIDNALNRIDFRAGEKAFVLLKGLQGLAKKKLVIQTRLAFHHCFKALTDNDVGVFYEEELLQRRQLGFPPYRHIIMVKMRGRSEDKVKKESAALFERLNKSGQKGIKFISVNPAYPPKLRGNFYWQVLASCSDVFKASAFLKTHLKKISRSGIIVTVDVDPL